MAEDTMLAKLAKARQERDAIPLDLSLGGGSISGNIGEIHKQRAVISDIEKSIEAEHTAFKALMLKALPNAVIKNSPHASGNLDENVRLDSPDNFFYKFLDKREKMVFTVSKDALSASAEIQLRPFKIKSDGSRSEFRVDFVGDSKNYRAFIEALISIVKEQVSEEAKGTVSAAAQKARDSIEELEKHVQQFDMPFKAAMARAKESVDTALEKAIVEPSVSVK